MAMKQQKYATKRSTCGLVARSRSFRPQIADVSSPLRGLQFCSANALQALENHSVSGGLAPVIQAELGTHFHLVYEFVT